MMEAASTSETSENFYQSTQRNNPGYSHLHSRRLENLKSHNFEVDREFDMPALIKATYQQLPCYFYLD
jgi:hypothetical protein